MAEVVMPRLSDTMEEGTVLRWIKHDGEHVRRGEELVEIETDKAAMVYESDQDGVLHTVAAEGETLPIGATIAHIGDGASGGEASDGEASGGRSGDDETSDDAVAADAQDAQPHTDTSTTESQPASSAPEVTADAAPPARDGERVKVSPVARRIARERGVELGALHGSGPGGRIVKADVESSGAAPAGPSGTPAESSPAPTLQERVAGAKGETTIVELTRTQQTIARRMAESKATIPDFALQAEVDMERCVALRGELKRLSPVQAPTYNDMVVKACALALREYPRANGGYRDGKLQLHSRVNVGVAVAAQEALVVPTVFDADVKSLGEIARETRALAERVRAGTITPPELGGGTFTVSNLGMYGVRSFTAIVNPPQAAILSVGALEPRAVVRDGEIVARHTLAVTLVCDHRILYGADAAELLARIRALLEEPAALTL
jgi:pyruvate dehydrogenase E2 component (dihydrolipoamide acetyltransferase)